MPFDWNDFLSLAEQLATGTDEASKRTAISLPDDLYRNIERARRRAKKDRSTWIQEAAEDYLRKRTRDELRAQKTRA